MAQNFIGCDRDQSFLMPPDIRDWLPEDHLAWFVLSAVEQMQQQIVDVVRRLEDAGEISLQQTEESEEFIQ